MARQQIVIDRDKLLRSVRKLSKEIQFSVLSNAIDLLLPSKLYRIAKKYLDVTGGRERSG